MKFVDEIETLRQGDVVRFRHRSWPEGSYQEGPVFQRGPGGMLNCGGVVLENWAEHFAEFEVVKRAPRSFYVNHDREKPLLGDVARTTSPPFKSVMLTRRYGWLDRSGFEEDFRSGYLKLLVDGPTGQVVDDA